MRESFSKPVSKEQARQEIEEGIAEYLASSKSKEGMHAKLADTFEVERSEQPLNREEVEKEIEGFVGRNLELLLPALLSQEQDHAELIQRFGLTNKKIGLLGANYYIRKQYGKPAIFKTDEYYPEGRRADVSSTDLLALAYAKENIRVDSKRETGRSGGNIPHRYYLKSKHRYLCANDFGMRVWNEEEGKMNEGDITNATPFIQTAKQQMERIKENLSAVSSQDFENIQRELYETAKQAAGVEYLDYEQQQVVAGQAQEQLAQNLAKRFAENLRDKELVFGAVPIRKVKNHLHFNFDKIAKKYGFVSDDPEKDYRSFDQNSPRLNRLLREPTEEERAGVSLDFVYSDFYRKPVIIGTGGGLDRASVISEARSGVKKILAVKAVENDPQAKELFDRARSKRGRGSPYFYPDHQLYDFIKMVGVERAQQVLEADERNVSKQMTGFETLKAMKYDISKFEPDQLKKQLHQANTLERSGLWRYLAERNKTQIEQARTKLGTKAEDKHWLELLGVRGARDQFREGKRMYWLGKQVWMHSHTPGDRFYRNDSYVNWDRYDLTKADVSEEKLNKYLEKQKNLIVALLGQGSENRYGEQPEQGKSATLGLIIQALEQGNDIRGVALAHDKQRYLEGVIGGQVKNDLEFATEDWPADWRKAVSEEEINLYYEYASDYVLFDPNGLAKYATWRATSEGKEWDKVFRETPKRKQDLDFRICLGTQTEEVRGWYKGAAEYVGGA